MPTSSECARLGSFPNLRVGRAEMFGHQPFAHFADGGARGLVFGFEDHIAFGVQSHRAIVQIRRTDPQQPVVDNHQLRVHVDRRFIVALGNGRIIDAQALMPIGAGQASQQPHAVAAHDELLGTTA